MSEQTKHGPAPTETRPPHPGQVELTLTCICGVSFGDRNEKMLRFHEECPRQRFIHDKCPDCGNSEPTHYCPKRNSAPARAAALEEPPLLPLSFPTWMATRSTISREDYDTVKHWWKKYETEHLKPETVAAPEREPAPRSHHHKECDNQGEYPVCICAEVYEREKAEYDSRTIHAGIFPSFAQWKRDLAAASSPVVRPQQECMNCNGTGIEGYATSDMASDAGDKQLEGTPVTCRFCDGHGIREN